MTPGRLREVLDRLGADSPAVPLAGGTSTGVYHVGGQVVRLVSHGDATSQADLAGRAAATGVSPAVAAHYPDLGALVLEHVDGRTLTELDLRDPAVLHRVAVALRQLHTAELSGRRLDMHTVLAAYATAPDLPPGWVDQLRTVQEYIDDLADSSLVLCHGDLVAANLVDDGRRVWLVDLDDAVDADPAYDLGNLWVQAGLDDSALDTLVDTYGGVDVDRVLRWAVVVAYTWTAWSRLRARAPVPAGYDPLAFGNRLWEFARARLC